ncbi:MAG: hypothetical protein JW969_18525 [Spirochaetales bacterium]|nr:hypothetical protein [Spirochaetales bacterium]
MTLVPPSGSNTCTVLGEFRDEGYHAVQMSSSIIYNDGSVGALYYVNYESASPKYTNNPLVTVNFGDLNAVGFNTADLQMCFSNNNATWTTWVPYAATTGSWDLTAPATGGNNTDEAKTVYARIRTSAMSESNFSDEITLDRVAPVLNTSLSINSGASLATSATVSLSFNVSDLTPVTMRFSNNNANWSGWIAYSTPYSWDITAATYGGNSDDGNKSAYVQFQDSAGNGGTASTDDINVDINGPSSCSVVIGGGSSTNTTIVSLTLSAVDFSSPMQMSFSNNGSSWSGWEAYSTTRSSWDFTNATYGGTSTQGTKYVYARFQDPYTHISASVNDTVTYDLTPPNAPNVGTAGTTGSPTNITTPTWYWTSGGGGGNGTYRYKVDNSNLTTGATVTTSNYCQPGSLSGGTGTAHTLYVQEQDAAGNWSASGSHSITIDTVAPSAPASVNPTANTGTIIYDEFRSAYRTIDTTPTFTWSSVSGAANYYYRLGTGSYTPTTLTSVTITTSAGTRTFYVYAQDAAGNASSATTINIINHNYQVINYTTSGGGNSPLGWNYIVPEVESLGQGVTIPQTMTIKAIGFRIKRETGTPAAEVGCWYLRFVLRDNAYNSISYVGGNFTIITDTAFKWIICDSFNSTVTTGQQVNITVDSPDAFTITDDAQFRIAASTNDNYTASQYQLKSAASGNTTTMLAPAGWAPGISAGWDMHFVIFGD